MTEYPPQPRQLDRKSRVIALIERDLILRLRLAMLDPAQDDLPGLLPGEAFGGLVPAEREAP